MENLLYILIPLALLALAVLGLYLRDHMPRFKRVTVRDWQVALLFRHGVLKGVLEPGPHWIVWPWEELSLYEKRVVIQPLAPQEVLTADQAQVKATMALSYRIADPVRLRSATASLSDTLHLAAQLALRQVLGALTLEEVMAKRADLDAGLRSLLEPQLAAVGLALEGAALKDLMLPAEIKSAFAAELRARHEGLAKLEQARAEAAVLRNLANQSRLLKESPELLQLRSIQLLADAVAKGGSTLVWGAEALKGAKL
jgi:regulator of protease activity HflC (stomatin/prohibitin superfamily)